MKISCTQENLFTSLSIVSRVASRGGALPILNNLLLRAEKTGLVLIATNLEMAVTSIVRGKVEEGGVVAVNAKLLHETVALLPKERVDIDLQGTNLRLSCGKQTSVLKTTTAEEFPIIPEINNGSELVLGAEDVVQALNGVLFAINPNESRPEITGVRVIIDEVLKMVGTDSFRLAEYSVEGGRGAKNAFTLPLRSAQEIQKIINNELGELKLIFNENQLKIIIGETQIISRLAAGEYPDYQQIIPKTFITSVVGNREEWLRVVRAAGLFARTGINDIEIKLNPQQKTAAIAAVNNQVGEYLNEIGLVRAEGEELRVVFNYHYLLEGLQAINTKEVCLELVGENAPGLLTPVGQTNYRYLLMPIRQ